MKRLSLLLLLVLLLAACDGAPGGSAPPANSNPIIDQAVAVARQTSTAVAVERQGAEATAQAAKENRQTDNQIRVIMAQVDAKNTEVALQLTQGAFELSQAAARVTQTAASRRSEQEALEAEKRKVEMQLEIAKQQRQDQADQVWNDFWMYGGPILLFLLGLVFVVLLWWLPPRIQAALLRERSLWEGQKRLLARQKESVLALTDGTKIWFDEQGRPEIVQPGEGSKPLPAGATAGIWSDGTPLIVREVGGSVNISRPRTVGHSTTDRCLELVNAAIQKEGLYGQSIPRFDKLAHYDGTPYYSEEWQELIGALEAEGIVVVVRSSDGNGKPGTYLTDPDDGGRYETLGGLRDALQSGRQFVRPLKKAPSPSQSLPLAGD